MTLQQAFQKQIDQSKDAPLMFLVTNEDGIRIEVQFKVETIAKYYKLAEDPFPHSDVFETVIPFLIELT